MLSKEDIGKWKPWAFKLPDEGFSYGKADKKDKEGAKEVITSWSYSQQNKTTISK